MIPPSLLLSISPILFILWMLDKRRAIKKNRIFRQKLDHVTQLSKQTEKQMAVIFDAIPDGIAVIDKEYNLLKSNAAYSMIAGKNSSPVTSRKCFKILQNLEAPCDKCPLSNPQYKDGFELSIHQKKFQVEVTTSGSENTLHIESIRNISRFEDLQAKLRRSERLASLGTMVAGIAHEINNPLSGISGNSQLMIRTPEKYGLNEKGQDRVKTIFHSVERATHIVNNLLYLSKPSQFKFKRIELITLIQETLYTLDETIKNSHQLNVNHPKDKIKIWGHKNQLIGVLSRIILNSHHAIQEKKKANPDHVGKIEIEYFKENKNIILNIMDNGCGIPKENLAHIFDPFYTTKDPGSGPGLGLSICHRIVGEHSANINISNIKDGVKAQFIFPTTQPK